MWRVRVSDACIGSGSCVALSPKHFTLDEHNRSRATPDVIAPDEAVLDAAASCPMEAISVTDAGSGEPVEF